MQFLIDESLSPQLATFVKRLGYDALSAREAGLKGCSDIQIIEWAQKNNNAIITGDLDRIVLSFEGLGVAGIFFAGLMFTTALTTAPAIASFLLLAHAYHPLILASVGAIGAMIADTIMFKDLKSIAGKDINIGVGKSLRVPHIKSRFMKLISPLLAGFLIASPPAG